MHKQLSDSEYTKLRKDLLKDKGSDYQKEFLEKLKDSGTFCKWFRSIVSVVPGEDIPLYGERLTENEYKDAPQDTEEQLYENWKSLTSAVACRPPFWGEVTLSHIENGLIESSYLAANGGSLPGGRERIDRVLTEDRDQDIDSCVRTALRRFSGLPEARGNRSVFVNCSFGRAWWRMRLCEEVCQHFKGKEKEQVKQQTLRVLRLSQEYWENVVSFVVSRNSILGDRRARDVLVWVLGEKLISEPKSPIFKSTVVVQLYRVLGVRAAWQEFGVLERAEMKDLIETEISTRW